MQRWSNQIRRRTRRARLAALGSALVLLHTLVLPCRADDPPPPEPGASPPAAAKEGFDPIESDGSGVLVGDTSAMRVVGDEMVFYAVGGQRQPVWLRIAGLEVRADALVIWGDRETLQNALTDRAKPDTGTSGEAVLGPVLHALYAEGDVYLKRDNHTVRARQVLVDFAANRAYMVDAELRALLGRGPDQVPIPLTVRADAIRGVAKDRFLAEDPSFTSCTYAHPHLEFTTDRLEIELHDDHVWFETGWWPAVRVDTAFGRSTPILVLPKLGGRGFGLRPLQDVSIGSSSRFGTELRVTWGGDVPGGEDDKPWGAWTVHTDWLTERGAGLGVDLDMESRGDARGGVPDEFEVRSMVQADTERRDDFSDRPYDGLPGRGEARDRARFHLWFRTSQADEADRRGRYDSGWRATGELSRDSDRGYLPEYFRDETLVEKQQETFIQFRRTFGNEGVSFLASRRLNDDAVASLRGADPWITDYQNQTDVLPGFTYHMIDEPLLPGDGRDLPPLLLSLQAGVARIERDYDDVLARRIRGGTAPFLRRYAGWHGEPVFRGDAEARLSAPFSLGPVHLVPAVGGSFYGTDDANGFEEARRTGDTGSETRTAAFAAFRAGVEFHRTLDAESQTLDVHGLRHVVSLDAQWFDRFHAGTRPLTFQSNDQIDELDEVEIASFRMRQRLQTHRDGEVVDLIDGETRYLTFLDESGALRARPFGLREDFAQPLQRLDFPGEDKYRSKARDGAAFLQQRLRVQALANLWLIGEGDKDLDSHEWETSAAGVRWAVDDRFSVYLGRRSIRHDAIIWTLRGDYRFSDRWGFSTQYQENTSSNRGLHSTIGIFRRAHDYTLAVEFSSDRLLSESSIALAVYPNDWLSGNRRDPFTDRRPMDFEALRWYR